MQYQLLGNKIHLIFQPAERNEVNLEFTYSSGGSWFEQPGDRGKRHLLEHCLVSSTKDMNFEQLKDYCFANEINLNAYTGQLTMSIVASGHKEDFLKILSLLLQFFLQPVFFQTDLDREKEIVLREISERSGDPNYVLYYDTLKQIFTPDSLDNNQVLGLSEEVAATTIADFSRIYQQILTDSHLIFKISGGFDPDIASDTIKSSLATLGLLNQTATYSVNFLPANKFNNFASLFYVHPFGHQHAEINLFLHCPVSFELKPAQDVFRNLYLRYGGILYDRLRDELGLVYSLHGQFRKSTQALEIQLACELPHVRTIMQEIESVFSDFERYFRPEKLDQMKDKMRKREAIATDKPSFLVDFAESNLLSFGVVEEYENYSHKVQAVTREEIFQIHQHLQSSWSSRKVVVVSRDEQIRQLELA